MKPTTNTPVYELDPATRRRLYGIEQADRPERTDEELEADRQAIEALYGFGTTNEEPLARPYDTVSINTEAVSHQIGETATLIEGGDNPGMMQAEVAELNTALHSQNPVGGKFARQLEAAEQAVRDEFTRLGLELDEDARERIATRTTSQVLTAGLKDRAYGQENLADETVGGMILNHEQTRQLNRAATAEKFLQDVRANKIDMSQLEVGLRDKIYGYMGFLTDIEQQTNDALAELGMVLEKLPAISRAKSPEEAIQTESLVNEEGVSELQKDARVQERIVTQPMEELQNGIAELRNPPDTERDQQLEAARRAVYQEMTTPRHDTLQ